MNYIQKEDTKKWEKYLAKQEARNILPSVILSSSLFKKYVAKHE